MKVRGQLKLLPTVAVGLNNVCVHNLLDESL